MFDDFVEHAPSRGRMSNSRDAFENSAFAQLRTEGFEPDDDDMSVDGTELQSGEAGYTSKPILDDNSAIFSMSKVQFSLPAELLSLQVNSNILVAAVRPLSLIVIDLNKPADLVNVDLPKPAANIEGKGAEQHVPRIASLYGDPSGRHLLISITSGDVFYLSTASLGPIASTSPPSARKPRPLRLRHTVSCVAWSPLATSTPLPNQTECLLASNEGVISSLVLPPNDDIFNLKSVSIARTYERDHVILYSLPEKRSVTGLSLGFGSTSSLSKKPQVWAVLTTSERLHLFHTNMASSNQDWNMTGKNGWGEDMFKDIETQDASLRSHYVPGDGPDSMVSSFWQLSTSLTKPKNVTRDLLQPSHLAWSTASGLYHFELLGNEPHSALTSATYESWTSLGSADGRKPLSILATKFHFILAFQTRLVSVSRLSGRIVWEQPFDLQSTERVLGLTSDPVKQTFWAYTSASLIEVVPKVEERNVWYLEMDRGNYEIALSYAKDQKQTDMIISRQADSLFQDQRYIQAAQAYAKCTRSFEYVALRFVDADEKDASRIYLSERLNRLPKANITQRMMLATWLIEIYLSKCNTLEDIIAAEAATGEVESLRTELSLMDEDLRTFITTYQNNLEPKVIYHLIQSHGRTDIYLFFARLLKDYAIVIQHFIDEEMWHEAIDVLNRQPTLDLYYQHASVLMAHVPEETTQTWLKNSALDVKKLVPALLSSYHASNAGGQKHAIQFLTIVVKRGNTDDVVHNLLLTMLVKHEDRSDTELLRFLNEAVEDPITQRPIFDLDYALRLCKQNDRLLPCVYIYAKMGRFESGVDLALEKGDIELAKTNADKPEDDIALKRKLWLKIARHAIQDRNDIKSAIKLLEQTELLKIEDILPFFPDFTVINAFKDEICDALEDYSSQIETLRGEMDDATSSAKKIQADIENLQARFITIDANERCSRCQGLLTMRHFYVFPCQHAFHADCMISLAKEYLPSSSLRRIVHLQDELIRLSKLSRKTSLTDSRSRTLLSATTNQAEVIASALDPANLLLGSSRKLLAAGDKLRELIVPDVLANAISIGGRGTEKAVTDVVPQENSRQTKLDDIRAEIDKVLASNCVLCEGAIATIDQPFVSERNGDDSWDL